MRHAMLVFAAVGALLAPLASAAERPSLYARFGDWRVGCDNAHACSALGLSGDQNGRGILFIEREADPEDPPSLSIAFNNFLPRQPALPNGITVEFFADRARLGTVTIGTGLVPDQRMIFELRDNAVRTAILAAMRRARRLVITFSNGNEALEISLQGATAALMFMDERQQRLGTITALAARGARPAAAVPTAPALPRAPRLSGDPSWPAEPSEVPDNVRERMRPEADDDCPGLPGGEIRAQTLGRVAADLVLVKVQCRQEPSQATYLMHLWNDRTGHVSRLTFDLPGAINGRTRLEALTSPDFDRPRLRLAHLIRGRNLGDCNETGEWAWNGYAFELVGYALMPACEGVPAITLTLYRSR